MLAGHSLADSSGHLLAVDHHVCEIVQRSQRELLGMSYEALTHPDDRIRNVGAITTLGALTGPLMIRKRYIRPDGSAVWANVQVSRLVAGDVDRLVGMIQLVDRDSIVRTPQGLWRSASKAQERIRRRRADLGDDLFSDYGWLLLLQIYQAEAEGEMADMARLSARAEIWPALAERWAGALVQKGLVEHCGDALQLTMLGFKKIENLLDGGEDA